MLISPIIVLYLHHFFKFPSNEEARLTDQAEIVLADLAKQFPDREYFGLVADFKGETWFLTRYLHPLNLPPGLHDESLGLDKMMMRMARFVALIPYEPDHINFAGQYDLWSTNEGKKNFINLENITFKF